MDLRTLGAPLLRPQSPFIAFLSTSAKGFVLPTRPSRAFVCRSCRQFSSITPFRQQAAAKAPESDYEFKGASPRQPTLEVLNEAMDFSRTSGVSAKQNSRFKSASDKLSRLAPQAGGSSVDDAISGLDSPSPEQARRAADASSTPGWAKPRQQPQTRRGRNADVKNIDFPTSDPTDGLEDPSKALVKSQPRVLSELNIHLSARTGRTMSVDPNQPTELGSRLRQLEMLVSRNRIRADFNRQRFHERGGLKRKRLASERWRRRFKEGFQRTVTRVQELRRKGW